MFQKKNWDAPGIDAHKKKTEKQQKAQRNQNGEVVIHPSKEA